MSPPPSLHLNRVIKAWAGAVFSLQLFHLPSHSSVQHRAGSLPLLQGIREHLVLSLTSAVPLELPHTDFFHCRYRQTPHFGWASECAGSFSHPKSAKSQHTQCRLGAAAHGEGCGTLHKLQASQNEKQFAFGQVAMCKNCHDSLFRDQKTMLYAVAFPRQQFLPNQLLDFNLRHSAGHRLG